MMVGVAQLAVSFLCLLCCCDGLPRPPVHDPEAAIRGLISRVLGEKYPAMFEYEVVAQSNGYDVMEVDRTAGGRPMLRGSCGVSLASALNYYLKHVVNCSVSWGRDRTGDQLNLPHPLPMPATKTRIVSPVKYRYYQNVCTVSYSMAWWDFARWERELDWMAMNGINMPLSFTGQEYIWQMLYTSIGLTQDEIKSYFSGPAFLAWQRMGNIRGWGGPLDDDWIHQRYEIQKMILSRATNLGMISVLPGFSGHVPEGLIRVHPNASYVRSAPWGGFNSSYSRDYLLEPTDPLFNKIGVMYYKMLIEQFGTSHVYNADTYNEMDPSSTDTTFLAETNQAIFTAMADVDDQAVFLMQGWLFHSGFWTNSHIEAFLSKVPNDRMIILDLNSEESPIWSRTQSYFGKPYIWCMLHNYGGTRGIYGNLATIATAPVDARTSRGSTMVGTGMTPEAIEHNPVMYDLMAEMGWSADKIDVDKWLEQYSTRRYGGYSDMVQEAWRVLKTSAYSYSWSWDIKSIVDRAPGFNMSLDTRFNVTGLIQAWGLLYQAGTSKQVESTLGPYRYDMVDIGRQCLVDLFYDIYCMFQVSYDKYNIGKVNTSSELASLRDKLMHLLSDLDLYLSTDTNFLLGHWIADAISSAPNTSSASVISNIEFNARNQITMWGPNANINDYASKEWAGLVNGYYSPRWELFLNSVVTDVINGRTFDSAEYRADLFKIESNFSYSQSPTYPVEPSGDLMDIAGKLLDKYVSKSSLDGFTAKVDTDMNGHDLFGGRGGPWVRDVRVVAYLCLINPSCVGFNNKGTMMDSSGPMVASPGSVLYLKKTPI